MKRIIILAFIVLAGYSAMAQPAAGKLFVGGNFSIYTQTNKEKSEGTTHEDYTETGFDILPMAGYFLSDRLAVGAQLGVSSSIYKDPDVLADKQTSTVFRINPFGRYYLISGTGGLFAEASFGLGIGTTKYFYEATTSQYDRMMLSAGVAPGVYYYFTPKLALEGKFGWFGFSSDVRKDGDNKDILNEFGLNINPSTFSFGLTYTL